MAAFASECTFPDFMAGTILLFSVLSVASVVQSAFALFAESLTSDSPAPQGESAELMALHEGGVAIIGVMRQVLRTMLGLGFVSLLSMTSARAADAPDRADGRIVILPFTAINPAEPQPWLGKSIQQSLLADLTIVAPSRVLASDLEAKDDAGAADNGRKAGAAYVIVGNFATAGQDLRVTGQVLDVASGRAVTAIKATGSVHEVFLMEDELAAQVRRRLQLNPTPVGDAAGPSQDVPPPSALHVQQEPPDAYTRTYVAPPAPLSQTEYNYYYSNPYGGYTPYYGSPYYYGGWGWGGWGWGVSSWGINVWGVSLGYASPNRLYRYDHSPSNAWNGSYAAGVANSVNGVPVGPNNTASISSGSFVQPSGFRAGITFHDSHTTIHATTGGSRFVRPAATAAPAPHH